MFLSDFESRDEVASSKISIGASFKIALPIAILCLWPPDNSSPLSPMIVSSPFGNSFAKSSMWAVSAAFNWSAVVVLVNSP